MNYIALNTRHIGASPVTSCVFPFLQESEPDASGNRDYALALLVSVENEQAEKFLESLGFSAADPDEILAGWKFMVAGSDAPFRPLTNDASAPSHKLLSNYLTFTFSAAGEMWPDTITVHEPNLSSLQFNSDCKFNLAGVELQKLAGVPAGWTLRWKADLDNDSNEDDDVLTNWSIPLDIADPIQPTRIVRKLALVPLANGASGDDWQGCELHIEEVRIAGGVTSPLDVAPFQIVKDDIGWHFRAEVRETTVAVGSHAVVQMAARDGHNNATLFVARYRASERQVETTEEIEAVILSARFPLIMAPANSPTAVSKLVPLLSDTLRELFHFEFRIETGSSIDPFAWLVSDERDQWAFNPKLWAQIEDLGWNTAAKWIDAGSSELKLGGWEWGLSDLIGEALNIDFRLRPFTADFLGESAVQHGVPCRVEGGSLHIPVSLEFGAGNRAKGLNFCLDLSLNPANFRLATNCLAFRLPSSSNCSAFPVLDLAAFAIILPLRGSNAYLDSSSIDGFLDFDNRAFTLFAAPDGSIEPPVLAFPGNLDKDLSQRLLFKFEPFHPDAWPNTDNQQRPVFLRFNGEGVSLYAKIMLEHRPNIVRGNPNRRPLCINGQPERNGKTSDVVIINSRIARAAFAGEFEMPAVDDMLVKVEISMSQDRRGQPPTIHAAFDWDKTNDKPIANLSVGNMKLQIDDLRARLTWDTGANTWSVSVPVDASFMLADDISNTGGLDDLSKSDVIKVTDLDLLNIHDGFGSITLPLPENVNFTCLDGMFGVSLANLSFTWGDSFRLTCDSATFTFRDPGAFDVAIEVGGVVIDFYPGGRVKMQNPSRLGIDATIGDSVRFRGAVAWVDNDRENYFAAAGTLAIEGMPEAKALLKIGTGKKQDGQIVPNVAIYGSMDYEVQLFSGVVAKNFGAGLGINNRLAGIPERPTAEQMLTRIDDIDPSRIEGWSFVDRNGFYLSIVGTAIIASNPGGNGVVNAYVASIVLSIDIDLNIVAAAKVWLASSVDYVRQRANWNRPALIGAVAILPRERLFTAAIESRNNPAIESSALLSKILEKGKVRMAFVLSPSLVDFHLKEVSYRDNFLGFDMLFQGSFRLAALQETLLVRAGFSITGRFEKRLEAGIGGFHAKGNIFLGIEYGGLLSRRGLAFYGLVGLQVTLDVSAWITIGFSFTIGWGRWKKRVSFEKTFHLGTTRIEIGLEGVAAVNENGEFGFAGRLSISVPICGYRLSISPAFAINEGVVRDVRTRVSAFESRLEDYRRRLVEGPRAFNSQSVARAKSLAEDVPSERWLHYQIGNYHLLVPHPAQPWFTPAAHKNNTLSDPNLPFPFSKHVTQIRIEFDSGDAAIELSMPWTRDAWSTTDPPRRRESLEEIELSMVETIAPGDEVQTGPPAEGYYVVSDPRVESTDRTYWTAEDQALLPSYALPIRLKTADQVLQSGEAKGDINSDYSRLVDYLAWQLHANDNQRHQGEDLLEEDEIEQKRAVVLREILEALRHADDATVAGESGWIARDNGQGRLCGLIFQTAAVSNWKVTITRAEIDSPIRATVEHIRDSVSAARECVQLLPPRQQFVPGQRDQGTASKVVVALPIKLTDKHSSRSTFLEQHLHILSHFEIYRRIPGRQPPVLVGGFQLPTVKRVPAGTQDQPVVVVEPYLFTERFEVTTDENRFTDPDVIPDDTLVEYAIRMVPLGDDPAAQVLSPWRAVKLHLPLPDSFPDDLMMLAQAKSLYRPVNGLVNNQWMEFQFIRQQNEELSLALTEAWEAAHADASADLPFEIWAEEYLISESGFYAGAAPLTSRSSQSPDLRKVDSQSNVITTDGKFQCAVIAVPEAGVARYRWRLSGEETFQRMQRPGYGYKFYIRSRRKGIDGRTVVGPLRELSAQLTKQALDVEVTPGSQKWRETPRLKSIGMVEWIDMTEVDAIRALCRGPQVTPRKNIVPVATETRGLEDERILHAPDELRRRIGISWHRPLHVPAFPDQVDLSRCLPTAGVTIRVADRDDSALQSEFVCELMERSFYQTSIKDFSNDSIWRLSRRESTLRLTHPAIPDPVPHAFPNEASQLAHIVAQTLDLATQDSATQVIKQRTRELESVMKAADQHGSWPAFAKAASLWVDSLHQFERSPLNLNDPEWRHATARVLALIRWTIIGFQPLATPNLNALLTAQIVEQDELLRGQLARIEGLAPKAAEFSDSDERSARLAYLDAHFSRKIAAVVRRRLALADDVINSRRSDFPLADAKAEQNTHWAVRGIALEDWRQKVIQTEGELGGALPESTRLLSLVPPPMPIDEPPRWLINRPDGTSGHLQIALKHIVDLIDFKEPGETSSQQRRTRAAATAAKAIGLNLSLNAIKQELASDAIKLELLPHHRVAVGEADDGAKTPQSIKIKDLLPDELRQIDGNTSLPNSSSANSIVAYMNLLERLGFATDVEATDRLGQRIAQSDLLRMIRNLDLPTILEQLGAGQLEKHWVFVFTPREPDSEHRGDFPDSETPGTENYYYTGLSFLKIAVVPETFVTWLVNIDLNPANICYQFIKTWLSHRGIEFGNNDHESLLQLRVFASAAELIGFDVGDDGQRIVQVRLTPLELQKACVPHIGGFAHIDYETTDRRGHRYEVSARSMSRYELLIRWAENLATPRTVHPGTHIDVRRIATGSDGIDLPIPLPVSVYPHPDKIQLAYTLPSAGVRSVLNRISAIRTGYKGCHSELKYQLLDHESSRRSWRSVLSSSQRGDGEVEDVSPLVMATFRNSSCDIKLFRHQRLLTLDHVPHFYGVTLSAHPIFDSDMHVAETDRAEIQREVQAFYVDPARRLPPLIAYRRPWVTEEGGGVFKIRVVLTRLVEMNHVQDLLSGMPLRNFTSKLADSTGHNETEVELSEAVLPELSLGYHFYDLSQQNQSGAGKNEEPVYESLFDVLMPWHPEYLEADGHARPWVRTLASPMIEVLNAYPAIQWHPVAGVSGIKPVPVLTFKIRVVSSDLFSESVRRYVQVSCHGNLSQITPIQENHANG